MAPDTSWAVHLDVAPGKYYRPIVEAAGPGLRDLLTLVVVALADAAEGLGEAADPWDAYTTARHNIASVTTFGAEEIALDTLEQTAADALDELLKTLPNTVRLPLTEAMQAGRLLERTAASAMQEIGRNAA